MDIESPAEPESPIYKAMYADGPSKFFDWSMSWWDEFDRKKDDYEKDCERKEKAAHERKWKEEKKEPAPEWKPAPKQRSEADKCVERFWKEAEGDECKADVEIKCEAVVGPAFGAQVLQFATGVLSMLPGSDQDFGGFTFFDNLDFDAELNCNTYQSLVPNCGDEAKMEQQRKELQDIMREEDFNYEKLCLGPLDTRCQREKEMLKQGWAELERLKMSEADGARTGMPLFIGLEVREEEKEVGEDEEPFASSTDDFRRAQGLRPASGKEKCKGRAVDWDALTKYAIPAAVGALVGVLLALFIRQRRKAGTPVVAPEEAETTYVAYPVKKHVEMI